MTITRSQADLFSRYNNGTHSRGSRSLRTTFYRCDLLASLAEEQQGLQHGCRIAELVGDLRDGSRGECLDLETRLLGFDFGDDIALLDLIADLDMESHNLGLRQVLPHLGNEYRLSHANASPR